MFFFCYVSLRGKSAIFTFIAPEQHGMWRKGFFPTPANFVCISHAQKHTHKHTHTNTQRPKKLINLTGAGGTLLRSRRCRCFWLSARATRQQAMARSMHHNHVSSSCFFFFPLEGHAEIDRIPSRSPATTFSGTTSRAPATLSASCRS